MDAHLRGLRASDREPLAALVGAIPEFTPGEVAVAVELIDAALAGTDDYRFVVAETGGAIAGYVCYGPTPMTESTFDLYWIAVAPAMRSAGLGGALVAAAERAAAEAGGRMLVVETASNDAQAPARLLYESRGYEVVGRIADFYRLGDDQIVYRTLL